MTLAQVGTLAAIYPAVWGMGQLVTGAWSDRVGRKKLIVAGKISQALGIAVIAFGGAFEVFALGAALIGAGTAMVYPTLLAAIGDVAHPSWRASAVGVYRLWRDSGYAVGAVLAGLIADSFGLVAATLSVAALNLISGLEVALRLRETLNRATKPTAAPSATCVEPMELRSVEGAVIIDVRSPDEFAAGHVDGAINIPLDSLAARASALPKNAVLVTVCGKGGGRSERAATELRALGFDSARSLCGGTQAWLQLAAQGI